MPRKVQFKYLTQYAGRCPLRLASALRALLGWLACFGLLSHARRVGEHEAPAWHSNLTTTSSSSSSSLPRLPLTSRSIRSPIFLPLPLLFPVALLLPRQPHPKHHITRYPQSQAKRSHSLPGTREQRSRPFCKRESSYDDSKAHRRTERSNR